MTQLRTAVLMKTDIARSTPQFRALLAADRQSLLEEHRSFLVQHAAHEGGRIFKSDGDGYWLEFSSVTAAARAAVVMMEALRLAQPNKGDDRLVMRVVIGLGDVTMLDNDLAGEVLALMARIEAITPPEEIYLTLAAHHALTSAEVQTALVERFPLKGFAELIPVYRVALRHRTHVISDAYIFVSDLRGFTRLTDAGSIATIERALDALESLTQTVAREFDGTIRFSVGDSYCLTFPEAAKAIAAAERLSLTWEAVNRGGRFDCPINIAVHRGSMSAFRSFLYGEGMLAAGRLQRASMKTLAEGEGGIFVSSTVREALPDERWRSRLRPVALDPRDAPLALQVYALAREVPVTC
jgi:class 3 adenylate cyclase